MKKKTESFYEGRAKTRVINNKSVLSLIKIIWLVHFIREDFFFVTTCVRYKDNKNKKNAHTIIVGKELNLFCNCTICSGDSLKKKLFCLFHFIITRFIN